MWCLIILQHMALKSQKSYYTSRKVKGPENYSTVFNFLKNKNNKAYSGWCSRGCLSATLNACFPFVMLTFRLLLVFWESREATILLVPKIGSTEQSMLCNLKVNFLSKRLVGTALLTPINQWNCLTFISASQYSHCQKSISGSNLFSPREKQFATGRS